MKQRQLRLGDVLDDYCPRERRLTNHVVVAMVGDAVKQTRCTTCEAEHEYKQAKIPRQRRKTEPAALYSQVLASAAPKKVVHEPVVHEPIEPIDPIADESLVNEPLAHPRAVTKTVVEDAVPRANTTAGPDPVTAEEDPEQSDGDPAPSRDDGPVHRPLIRAQLPRQEQGASRPFPDFTIRQPAGRPGRFRPRQHGGPFRGGGYPKGNVGGGKGNVGGGGTLRGASRPVSGRPPVGPHAAKHRGSGRKRSK